ncbi:MAG: FecR domain-containing protein [Candidatus Pseudobacter hemicellulosilyticus]|uniref:FecR domain-containing protein n=1 Tax=Candidatus Pseudobacter hemicellulosilyticus TaxID=3121375 RepID=A0AAJ6BI25_9BACT|nr:MAG: FecR domain-containing protein [Pseudobacter sp.]
MPQPTKNIEQLWQLYVTRQASPDEVKALFAAIEAGDDAAQAQYFQQALANAGLQPDQVSSPAELDTAWAELLALLPEQHAATEKHVHTPHHRVTPLWQRWLVAASITLLVGSVAYWTVLRNTAGPSTTGTPAAPVNLPPGGNRALLTLADGQQLTLDILRGRIWQQEGLAVSNQAGQLDYSGSTRSAQLHTLSTPRGGQYQLTLPDGSKVWLNAASSLRYPTAFTGGERRVRVTGEVYIEIAPDARKPFFIEAADHCTVQVLGTQVNINSYADDGAVRTTLLEGSVKVIAGGKALLLQPGQQAGWPIAAVNKPAVLSLSSPDLSQVMAWKNGLFNFNDCSLPVAMRQLERWYDIQVKYEGPVPGLLLRGKMDRAVMLQDVLEFLSGLGLQCHMEGRTLILRQ